MEHEDLQEQFDQYGVSVTPELIKKCAELMIEFGVSDGSDFVEGWLAYALNHGVANPTAETLTAMAQADFGSKKDEDSHTAINEVTPRIYTGMDDGGDVDDDIMGAYVDLGSPKRKNAKSQLQHTPRHVFSPASYSPITSASRKVKPDAGNAIVTFGQSSLVKGCQWTHHRSGYLSVNDSKLGRNLPLTELYMTDSVSLRCRLTGDSVFRLSDALLESLRSERADSADVSLEHCNVSCLDKITTAGLVLVDSDVTSKNGVFLVGLDETTLRKTRLDFSKCPNYSVFPGQVVLVSGLNSRGDCIMVDQIYSATQLTHEPRVSITKPLTLVIASGPFTAPNSLYYGPLEDLVSSCSKDPPDLLILTGAILSSHTDPKTLRDMAERYDSHFEKVLQKLMHSLSPHTHVLVVASHEDVNATYVYPTFRYKTAKKIPNLNLFPDPCVVNVDGVQIGVTSTDVITELGERELSHNDGFDKVKRAVNYLFHQKSFYPIRAPRDVPLDVGLAARYARLETIPHLMVLPSSSKAFIRDYNGCLCVNPGQLAAKNDTECGKFARVVIHPPDNETQKLYHFVAGQVLKI